MASFLSHWPGGGTGIWLTCLLVAFMYLPAVTWSQATGSPTPSVIPITTGGRGGGGGSEVSAGAIAGIVVGCGLVAVFAALVSYKVRKRNHVRHNAVLRPIPLGQRWVHGQGPQIPEVSIVKPGANANRTRTSTFDANDEDPSATEADKDSPTQSDTFESFSRVNSSWSTRVKVSDSLRLLPVGNSYCIGEGIAQSKSSPSDLSVTGKAQGPGLHAPLPPLPNPRRKEFNLEKCDTDSLASLPTCQQKVLPARKMVPASLLASAEFLFGGGGGGGGGSNGAQASGGPPADDPALPLGSSHAQQRLTATSPVSMYSQTEPMSEHLQDLHAGPQPSVVLRCSSRLSSAAPSPDVSLGDASSIAGEWGVGIGGTELEILPTSTDSSYQAVAVIHHTCLPECNFIPLASLQEDNDDIVHMPHHQRNNTVASLGSGASKSPNRSHKSLRQQVAESAADTSICESKGF